MSTDKEIIDTINDIIGNQKALASKIDNLKGSFLQLLEILRAWDLDGSLTEPAKEERPQ